MSEPDFTPLIEAATQRIKEKFERDVMHGTARTARFLPVQYDMTPDWWPPRTSVVDQLYQPYGFIVRTAI